MALAAEGQEDSLKRRVEALDQLRRLAAATKADPSAAREFRVRLRVVSSGSSFCQSS